MNEEELTELELYFCKAYGYTHIVPETSVKAIDVEKAKLLFSLRIPICFYDATLDRYEVANYYNPFAVKVPEKWYAWVDKEQEDGDRQ